MDCIIVVYAIKHILMYVEGCPDWRGSIFSNCLLTGYLSCIVPFDKDDYIKIMIDKLSDIIPRWKKFARELGLDNTVIQEIDGNPNKCEECFSDLLERWIQYKGDGASIRDILRACERLDKDLADRLRTDKEMCSVFQLWYVLFKYPCMKVVIYLNLYF